jgi:hypothetical protein
MAIIPASTLTTISNLKRGDWAALWRDTDSCVRIRRTEPMPHGGVWVTWDHGPGTKATRRMMPGANAAQVRW